MLRVAPLKVFIWFLHMTATGTQLVLPPDRSAPGMKVKWNLSAARRNQSVSGAAFTRSPLEVESPSGILLAFPVAVNGEGLWQTVVMVNAACVKAMAPQTSSNRCGRLKKETEMKMGGGGGEGGGEKDITLSFACSSSLLKCVRMGNSVTFISILLTGSQHAAHQHLGNVSILSLVTSRF